MEGSKYHIVYVSRRAREDTVVRAAPASQGGPGDAANERQTGDLGNDIETLLKYNDVHLCATGTSCLSKLSELHGSPTSDLQPTVVLIDTPHDEPIPASHPRSRSTSPRARSPPSEAGIHTPDDEVYGLSLLQRVITEAHLRSLSKLIVPIPIISNSSSAVWSDDPSAAASSSEPDAVDPTLIQRCIDLGAADVIVSPIGANCMTTVGVQAYRAHKEAAQEREAMMEVRRGRKISWVGVSEEKPFAYLREAMVSGLMKGICRLGGDVDDGVRNFKLAVSTERQAAVAAAIGQWRFCAHEFSNDELLVAAMFIFKHALSMPALEKWRIPTDQLIDYLVACRVAYNTFVPYHNFRHVVDVLQATFHFLLSIGTLAPYGAGAEAPADESSPKSRIAGLLDPVDGLTMLITAIGHDVGHPGVNNGFLVNLNAPLAQLYNDRSVLESFHCAAYSQILRRYWPSVFEESKMRKVMISSILATDMGLHFDYMTKLADTQAKLDEQGSDCWDPRLVEEQKTLACSLLIKCADISNVARRHDIALQWMYTLADETSRQASMENELGITSSLMATPKKDLLSLSKGQLGFMKLFAIPLFQGVADIMPSMRYTVEELEANRNLFESGMQDEEDSNALRSLAAGDCEADANQTPETTIMTTPAAAAVVGDEGEIAVSPLDEGSATDAGYFVRASKGPEMDQHDEYRVASGPAPGAGFDAVADFAASDPFNMRYRLDSYDHGKSLSMSTGGKQRCSETTDGSNSAPYSGDWTSQATSATTGKMPLSPSTRGTSIESGEECERARVPEIKVPAAPTGPPPPPPVQVVQGEGEGEEALRPLSSNEEEATAGAAGGKAGGENALRKKPSRFRMNALNLFRRNKAPSSPGALAAGTENAMR